MTDLQIKIEDEAFEIRRRQKDIPFSYTTVYPAEQQPRGALSDRGDD